MIVTIICLALIFGVLNGLYDSTVSPVSTIISTKVLSAKLALLWVAAFNFIGYLFFKLNIADTVSKNIAHIEIISTGVIFSCLIASILWNLITFWFSIPANSSHILIGSFIGAVLAKGGLGALIYSTVFKIILFMFLTPFIGLAVAFTFSTLIINICYKLSYAYVEKAFRFLQLFSAAAYGLCQGTNDAQKVIGIIYLALIVSGKVSANASIPLWIVISCHGAIALGTIMGGRKTIRKMGRKITHLRPFEGFSAEVAGTLTLLVANAVAIPVSTTHILAGSVIGAGVTKRLSAIRWGISIQILWTWVLTIPVTTVVGWMMYHFVAMLLK
jgi:PiT family inorganic phosphate transporter